MKIFTVLVILAVSYVANSKELNSTMKDQLSGKIVQIISDDDLPLCIAYILNNRNEKLGIGVIDKDLNIITNFSALKGHRKLKIRLLNGINVYHSCELATYGGHLIEITLQLPLGDNSMDSRGFVNFRDRGMAPRYYHFYCPVAVAIGWDEENPIKKKQVLIHYEGDTRIITKPSSIETVYYVGRIGDPLFLNQQLIGILIEPENISGYATYENMWCVFDGVREIIYS